MYVPKMERLGFEVYLERACQETNPKNSSNGDPNWGPCFPLHTTEGKQDFDEFGKYLASEDHEIFWLGNASSTHSTPDK